MLCVDAPLLQLLPLADEEASVTELPAQNVSGPDAVIVAVGMMSAVTTKFVMADIQPVAF